MLSDKNIKNGRKEVNLYRRVYMEFTIGKTKIIIQTGDITGIKTEAIVNAANNSLLGGGGVDGAIHRKAGPGLLEECRTIGGCPTGEARITGGFNLPARYVIHTVGPVYQGGGRGEETLLASAYKSSLQLAEKKNISSIAFPSISTGVYRYPMKDAAFIALTVIKNHLSGDSCIREVRMVLFNNSYTAIFENAAREVFL